MQVPVYPGTMLGLPNVIFSCGPDVGVSEGRDIKFTGDLLALQSINRHLAHSFPSSLSGMFLKLPLNSE